MSATNSHCVYRPAGVVVSWNDTKMAIPISTSYGSFAGDLTLKTQDSSTSVLSIRMSWSCGQSGEQETTSPRPEQKYTPMSPTSPTVKAGAKFLNRLREEKDSWTSCANTSHETTSSIWNDSNMPRTSYSLSQNRVLCPCTPPSPRRAPAMTGGYSTEQDLASRVVYSPCMSRELHV